MRRWKLIKAELYDIVKLKRPIFVLSLQSALCLNVRYVAPSHRYFTPLVVHDQKPT
jgi:hypothetical protein